MSEIFCAMDRVSRRKVVIKKMPLDPLNRSFSLQRYENEARNASLLPHDHIISILDYGEYDDVFYIVMEHVDGINLDQFMSSPAFKSDIGLMIVLTALQALHRAHQNGVIHCDIKPANILISRNGRVIVTDFGLSQAKAHAMDPEQGKHDFTTPLFMPPEQAKVIAEKVGLASDVWEETATVVYNDLSPEQARMLSERGVQWDLWSVGVLLYRMCCGRYPFNGNDLAGLLTSIVHSEATGIHELAADLPKPIASVIERCLEKEPYRRPHSLDPVINALKKHFAAVQSGAMQGMIAAQIQEQLAEGEKPEGSLLRTIRPVVSALPGMTARIVSRIGSKLWRMSTAILRAAGQRSRAEEREKPEGTVPFYAPAMSVLNSRFFKPVIALVGALFLVVIGTLVIKEFPVKDIRSAAVQLTGKKQAG
ncbi:MAG: serine/threonine protein kinase, partial [Chitinispirillaceae bacterium]|nr:serine/threonine protein kinase [Chitinispirillaceae bacterium]